MGSLAWHPLLELEIDPRYGCWELMRAVHRLLGFTPSDVLSIEAMADYQFVGHTWRAATELGDVLVGDERETGTPSHVSTLVDVPTRTVISSAMRRMEQRPIAKHAARAVCQYGVWRPRR